MPTGVTQAHCLLLGVVILCGAGAPVSAQSPSPVPPTPRAAVEQFWAAVWARDARRTAALIAPEALTSFRRQQLLSLASFAEMAARRRARGPGAAATEPGEINAISFDRLPERLSESQRSLPVGGIPGIERLGQLEALAPADFFERLMSRWATVRSEPVEPGSPDAPPAVLGEVADGDSVAHVVYRSLHSLDPESAERQRALAVAETAVMTVRRTAQGWRVVPDFFVFAWLAPPWGPTDLEGPPGKQ